MKIEFLKTKKNKLFFGAITLMFCLFNYKYAIGFENYYQKEASKYFKAAIYYNQNGVMPNLRYYFYGINTWLISIQLQFQLSPKWIVLFQLLLNYLAIIIFGVALKARWGYWKALLGIVILTSSYDWLVWNFYLYSESTFFSFTILWLSSLMLFPQKKYGILHIILLLLCVFSRPFGVAYVFLYGIFILQNYNSLSQKTKIAIVAFSISLVFFLGNLIAIKIEGFKIYKSTIQGCITCGSPTQLVIKNNAFYESTPIMIWMKMVFENPIIFLKLFFMRLCSFFSMYKPYFSVSHNIQNIVLKSIVYILIGYRIASKKFNLDTIEKSIVGFILVYLFFIGTQCNEWSMRFFAAIWPFLILLSFSKKNPLKD